MKELNLPRHRPRYRLSPNEVEHLKREETERRRKLRIIQVREQARVIATKIRHDVNKEKEKQLTKLREKVKFELDSEKAEEVKRLERLYDNVLRSVGQGHARAIETDKLSRLSGQQSLDRARLHRAEDRHRDALRLLAMDNAYKRYAETQHQRDRQAALIVEKRRSVEVASRPSLQPDPIFGCLRAESQPRRPVAVTDLDAFSTTHYHIPDFAVRKASPRHQTDGKVAGAEEEERVDEEMTERRRKEHDQRIRAHIRGKKALEKEHLKEEYSALLADLSFQQRADRHRRQHVVASLPRQVFLPAERHLEEMGDRQVEMERAFEDMYLEQLNLSGDISLSIDNNPFVSQCASGERETVCVSVNGSPIEVSGAGTLSTPAMESGGAEKKPPPSTDRQQTGGVLKSLLSKIKGEGWDESLDLRPLTALDGALSGGRADNHLPSASTISLPIPLSDGAVAMASMENPNTLQVMVDGEAAGDKADGGDYLEGGLTGAPYPAKTLWNTQPAEESSTTPTATPLLASCTQKVGGHHPPYDEVLSSAGRADATSSSVQACRSSLNEASTVVDAMLTGRHAPPGGADRWHFDDTTTPFSVDIAAGVLVPVGGQLERPAGSLVASPHCRCAGRTVCCHAIDNDCVREVCLPTSEVGVTHSLPSDVHATCLTAATSRIHSQLVSNTGRSAVCAGGGHIGEGPSGQTSNADMCCMVAHAAHQVRGMPSYSDYTSLLSHRPAAPSFGLGDKGDHCTLNTDFSSIRSDHHSDGSLSRPIGGSLPSFERQQYLRAYQMYLIQKHRPWMPSLANAIAHSDGLQNITSFPSSHRKCNLVGAPDFAQYSQKMAEQSTLDCGLGGTESGLLFASSGSLIHDPLVQSVASGHVGSVVHESHGKDPFHDTLDVWKTLPAHTVPDSFRHGHDRSSVSPDRSLCHQQDVLSWSSSLDVERNLMTASDSHVDFHRSLPCGNVMRVKVVDDCEKVNSYIHSATDCSPHVKHQSDASDVGLGQSVNIGSQSWANCHQSSRSPCVLEFPERKHSRIGDNDVAMILQDAHGQSAVEEYVVGDDSAGGECERLASTSDTPDLASGSMTAIGFGQSRIPFRRDGSHGGCSRHSWATELEEYSLSSSGDHRGHSIHTGSLEEFSFLSDLSGAGGEECKGWNPLADTAPTPVHSGLEERSISCIEEPTSSHGGNPGQPID